MPFKRKYIPFKHFFVFEAKSKYTINEVSDVIDTMVNKVVRTLEKNKIIEAENKEIYVYGVEVFLNNIILMMSIVGIGSLIGELKYTLVFITFFPLLRKFTGGFHAKKRETCFIFTNLIHLGVISLTYFSKSYLGDQLLTLFLLFSLCIIFVVDPIENDHNPKTEEEVEKNKYIARLIMGCMAIISFLGFNYIKKWQGIFFALATVMCVVTAMMLPDYFKKGGM